MPAERSFEELHGALRQLKDAADALHMTVTEDRPARGDVMLVDQFAYAADDFRIAIEEAISAVAGARWNIAEGMVNAEELGRQLASCHRLANRATASLLRELAAPKRIDQLLRFGRDRKGEWLAWVSAVAESVTRCGPLVELVAGAIENCWLSVLERSAAPSVVVRAAGVGQMHCAVPGETGRG